MMFLHLQAWVIDVAIDSSDYCLPRFLSKFHCLLLPCYWGQGFFLHMIYGFLHFLFRIYAVVTSLAPKSINIKSGVLQTMGLTWSTRSFELSPGHLHTLMLWVYEIPFSLMPFIIESATRNVLFLLLDLLLFRIYHSLRSWPPLLFCLRCFSLVSSLESDSTTLFASILDSFFFIFFFSFLALLCDSVLLCICFSICCWDSPLLGVAQFLD